MTSFKPPSIKLNQGWIVTIPNHQAFTQPQFHFGDRVQWSGADATGSWRKTGQITGMHFTQLRVWQYQVRSDANSGTDLESDTDISCVEQDLQLIQSPDRTRQQLPSQSEWQSTAQAAQVLGLSPEQLRRLRRKGLFKVGHHCRDISIPGSGLSRWQWHIIRCGKALDMPPEKRSIQFK